MTWHDGSVIRTVRLLCQRGCTRCLKVSIATNRTWIGDDNQRKERTDWVPVTIFEKSQREWIEENVKKGDTVYVEASVAQTSYGDGNDKQYAVDVVATLFNNL